MRLDNALDDVFATGSHVRVLRALVDLPDGLTVSGRDIARRAGVSQPTAAEVLRALEDQGLLIVGRRPRAGYYRLNPEHVLAPALSDIFARERQTRSDLERRLADGLGGLRDVEAAYLFGSAARGDMRPNSDIDVAIKSRHELPEDIPTLDGLYRRFGNRVNVIRLREHGAVGLRAAIGREGKQLTLKGKARKRS
jgi:DNA-binding transcriptional ArsR family regulator